ncbi:hypothetical protein B4589_011620 [Halolamina sp. CBA1230]|uniref:hypothetical protein n=1 Tax=Halolamina sp. CBA1230 TaxID=1853690 RepID=UPI0009A21931|nr:hypothetical protein [Halolamina sp. CBA1230]QKY20990.1 hypothetical protein B4589_011620 [Halolamina sp. CBA1230]
MGVLKISLQLLVGVCGWCSAVVRGRLLDSDGDSSLIVGYWDSNRSGDSISILGYWNSNRYGDSISFVGHL